MTRTQKARGKSKPEHASLIQHVKKKFYLILRAMEEAQKVLIEAVDDLL